MVQKHQESPIKTAQEPIGESPMKLGVTVERIIAILEEYKRQSNAIAQESMAHPREWPNYERFRAQGRAEMADELLNRINHEVNYVAKLG
jgi:hypothetical protein